MRAAVSNSSVHVLVLFGGAWPGFGEVVAALRRLTANAVCISVIVAPQFPIELDLILQQPFGVVDQEEINTVPLAAEQRADQYGTVKAGKTQVPK